MTRRPSPRPEPRGDSRRASGTVVLVRALSKLGLASRAEAVTLVLAGRVRVDGAVCTDPGRHVVPEKVAIAIDARPQTRAPGRTVALHKPRGVVTTRHDPEGRPTVYALIAEAGRGLAPAGRLDLASSGLLVCTTDTRFADWLTNPVSGVEREYVVTVRGRLTPEDAAAVASGLEIDGEWLQPLAVAIRKASGRETHLDVVLTEGKNREIRRLFAAVGHEVTRLTRVRIGGLTLGALAPGRWVDISDKKRRAAFPEYSEGRSGRPRHQATARGPARIRGERT